MYKHFCLLLFFITIKYFSSAQNLVPNPGFEQMNLCPLSKNYNFSQDEIERYCADWYNSGMYRRLYISSQYLHECAELPLEANGVPLNWMGYQHAHSGKAMSMISYGYFNPTGRHFFGVKLIKPLRKGHRYDVSFFVSAADSNKFFFDNIGVMFYTQKTDIPDFYVDKNTDVYPDFAHVFSKQIIDNKINWTKIEDTFLADSDYQYMVVGNFFNFKKTSFKFETTDTSSVNTSSYYLDDFYVEEVKKTISYLNRIICKKDTIVLTASGADLFYWWSLNKTDTFSKNNTIKIPIDSNLKMFLLSSNGIDSIDIVAIDKPLRVVIRDTILCEIRSVALDAQYNSASYLWNTGDTMSFILVSNPGTYFVRTQTGSCSRIDTIVVSSCMTNIFIPNAFTPNNDGNNDFFSVKGVQVMDFTIAIFNRWGVQIFEANDMNTCWDGSFKGLPCEGGVYFYKIIYTSMQHPDVEKVLTGNVTILK